MADEAAPQSNPFLRALALGSARLYGRRALLSATAVVFLGFLLFRTLSWSEALIGYARDPPRRAAGAAQRGDGQRAGGERRRVRSRRGR